MDNQKNKKFSIKARLASFKYAFNGFRLLFKYEHNARIHLVIAILTCILGLALQISSFEWLAILILIIIVIGFEIINSAIERLCDFVSPDWKQQIKQIKDISSAAVLLAAILAVACGLIIFLPKIYNFIIEL